MGSQGPSFSAAGSGPRLYAVGCGRQITMCRVDLPPSTPTGEVCVVSYSVASDSEQPHRL